MKNWVISISFSLLILGGGIYGFITIKNLVPKQLTAPSALLVQTDTTETDDKVVPTELKEIIHETEKLVVKIQLPDGSLGSGFLYNHKGDIVTNAHVVANAKNVTVSMSDSREFTGTVIGISRDTDIAVVRVSALEGTTPLKIAKERKAEIGDEVLALGSPLGLQNTVTTGIISGVDRDFDLEPFHYEDVFQISAPITSGNSGGPLVDSKTGEVIGINSAGIDQGTIGFSIPIVNVIHILEGWSASPMTALPEVNIASNDLYSQETTYSMEDYALYLVNYFYENINYQDYVTAYSLLGSKWKSNTDFENFRNGYLMTDSVEIDNVTSTITDDTVSIVGIITAKEFVNGSSQFSKYKVTYEVRYENDQLKLVSGNGTKIE
ncbi:S1C family serine protease [Sporosarcina sp. SAFN-015]|uniref:S1C family serine protease n=1 Tax=Sporosarcina sp. SAFN-015 TaxID=3387274 RepID=UPI003F7FBA3E